MYLSRLSGDALTRGATDDAGKQTHTPNNTSGLLGSPLEVAWDLGALIGTPCEALPPTSKGAHVPLWLNVALSLVAPDCVIYLMDVHYNNKTQQ